MAETNDNTTVDQIDIDIDQLMGASNVMVPTTGKPDEKPNIFKRGDMDLSFLDKEEEEEETHVDELVPDLDADGKPKVDAEGKPVMVKKPAAAPGAVSADDINNIGLNDDDDDPKKGGRSKIDKSGLVELTSKLIEEKLLIPFDDDKKIEDYTVKDFQELFKANYEERDKKLRQEVPVEFFDSLPEELQYAAKYVADGGTDIKGMFRALAAVEEVRSLDPTQEGDQEQIVRSYLQATNFGTLEEIQEEIDSWKDRNELEAKANKFKPKLDSMQEQIVARKLQHQEALQKQKAKQANEYMDNVYKTLEPGELNGIKLDKKAQAMLYSGLVQPNYPSVSGNQTNLLGHLLEKYQFVEPNHSLVAEALWLLADPEGYKTKVREVAKKEVTAATVRALKTEEGRKIASSSNADDDDDTKRRTASSGGDKLKRPGQGFFKR